MKNVIVVIIVMLSLTALAQQPATPQEQTPAAPQPQTQAPAPPKACAIVEHEGGHALRNIMLLGVVGAVISKERYKVIETNIAGLKPGEKMHGDELQARTQGAKIIVLRKHEDLAEAREDCNK